MRRSLPVVLAVILFLLLASSAMLQVQADPPPANIVTVNYPNTVRPGGRFTVAVRVAYSARFGMIDVGIWDVETGTVVQSLVSNATLSGAGQSSYSFSLKAPGIVGRWHLAAITRVWLQDAWFFDKAGKVDFSVLVTNTALLVMNGLQPNSTIVMDGRPLVANSSTLILPLELGTVHGLGVPQVLEEGSGSRLVFAGWSDGLISNPRTLLITENVSISPIYWTQYHLTVSSDIGIAAGGGWYREGEDAVFGIPAITHYSPSFLGLLTDSYQFTAWSGDSTLNTPTSTILMDGPKTETARWARTATNLNLNGVGWIFTVASAILAIRAALVKGRGTRRTRKIVRAVAILLLIALPIVASTPLPVSGQIPIPTSATVVSIGDASWYYWNQPQSDTCILWLGGGLEYAQGGYLINPFEYESFGTIRFLQDLTKYYCVVALEKGPLPSPKVANRTIYQELIQSQFSVARQIHQWINAQGYKHIFLIGYSVGTDAATSIATGDPQGWTSSDGLILITALLPPNVINAATNLRTNLMLIYGHAPTFEATGLQFYQNAPSEGWHGSRYLHKEIHVLDQMGHEVWSPLKDNTYSPVALGITVDFIEKSKALQLGQITVSNTSGESNATYGLSDIELPSHVFWGDPFLINATVMTSGSSYEDAIVVAYDFLANQILAKAQIVARLSSGSVRLVMPSIVNMSQSSFWLLVLQMQGREWQVVSKPYPVTVSATNQITVQLNRLAPSSSVIFDGVEYTVPSTGQLQIPASRGIHTIEVQQTVDQNSTRYLFVQWSDSNSSASRSLQLEEDTWLGAIYREQYFVSILSPIGTTRGTGWYEANSTVEPSVQPVASNQPPSTLDHWTNGYASFEIGAPVQVTSPMTIHAVWTQSESPASTDSLTLVWVISSILVFSLLLTLNLRKTRKLAQDR